MAKIIFVLVLILHDVLRSQAEATGRIGYGFIGYGIDMYDPLCAYSCYSVISMCTLSCSEFMDEMDGTMMMSMDAATTSPECYATDDIFLQTLAWCISTRCDGNYQISELEDYWFRNVAGRLEVQPAPRCSYQQALAKVIEPPTEILVSGDRLNKTSLVADEDYISNFNAEKAFEDQEIIHQKYGLVVLLSCFIIPIGFSLLRFIPFPAFLATKFNSFLIIPPLWGSNHKQPIFFNLIQVPARGQAFFIFYIITINLVLSAANITSITPNAWYGSVSDEVLAYVSNRVGVLSFANIPLIFLYAGRNNLLLWLTDWQHSTFILLHRWIAYISTFQAILHSLIYLRIRIMADTYADESKLPYWIWGIIGTLSMSLLLPFSLFPIRQKIYELFLVWHIVFSVLTIVGCYLHILTRFQHQWGYEYWIIVAMVVWAFDRVMRFLRIARNGICTAKVTQVDEDYIRVDIKGVAAGLGHAYLYFPTLTWRVWENHPFSVASAMLPSSEQASRFKQLQDQDLESETAQVSETVPNKELEIGNNSLVSTAINSNASSHHNSLHSPGLTFFVRTRSGLTSKFPTRGSILVLVESMYGKHEDLSGYPSLICIAGGVGVTAVMPYLQAHPGLKKLYWGVRNEGIVKALESSLQGVDKEVFVGTKMVLSEVLQDSISLSSPDGVAVVISGPVEMADEVRVLVSKIGRKGGRKNIRLVEESFAW